MNGNPARIYYVFLGLLFFGKGSYVTGYVPFLQDIGLSLSDVAFVNVVYWFATAAFELPTGMLADGRSRAWSLKMSAVFTGLGALLYTQAFNVWSACLSETVLALGMAFLSGAHQAWIADALKNQGREQELRRVFGTQAMYQAVVYLTGSTAGAFIAAANYRWIWIPLIVTSCGCLYIAQRYMVGIGEPMKRVKEWAAFADALRALRESRELQWISGAMALFGATVIFNNYWSPYFKMHVGQMSLAWVWAFAFVTNFVAGWLVRRQKAGATVTGGPVLTALFVLGCGFGMLGASFGMLGLALAAMVGYQVGFGMFRPYADTFIQQRVESHYRATIGSLQSLVNMAGGGLASGVAWLALQGEPTTMPTIEAAWRVTGFVVLVGVAALLLVQRVRK